VPQTVISHHFLNTLWMHIVHLPLKTASPLCTLPLAPHFTAPHSSSPLTDSEFFYITASAFWSALQLCSAISASPPVPPVKLLVAAPHTEESPPHSGMTSTSWTKPHIRVVSLLQNTSVWVY